MEKLKQSPAELLKMVQIKPIEQECLDRVFTYLSKPSHQYLLLILSFIIDAYCFIVDKGKNNNK